MKRKALLAVSGTTAKALEVYTARDFLPFSIGAGNWNEYSLEDGFLLRLLSQAARSTDNNSAALIARQAMAALSPINPFYYTGGEEMFVALVRYDWPEAPEGQDCREVVAGRWCDLLPKANDFVSGLDEQAKVTSIYSLNASAIAKHVFQEARDFGLTEADSFPSIPEDLTGFPEWFQHVEIERRKVIFGIDAKK